MIRCEEVTKTFSKNGSNVLSLDKFTTDISSGEFIVVRGPSGSGKTTLLLTLGGMQRPSTGKVQFDEHDLYALSPSERANLRSRQIGFVFQMFYLVPYLDILNNVLLASPGKPGKVERQRAVELLEQFGLSNRITHRPDELSAGERQRLAVARALLNRPKILLADEPTGNLDPDNAAVVIDHFVQFHQSGGTVVLVTHGTAADAFANRIIRLNQGRLIED
ncbi:MAG: ABC transporter ATP-binding protein [Verrucomicrobiota bacterium]|nr:ABC transporter ATP-binding protein [Verrucomicrobiota bacterium]